MKRALALAAMVLTAQLSGPARAAETAKSAKPDPAKGQEIVTKVCAACHGPDGNSVVSTYPKLAGQFPEYIQKQLNNFKVGANGKAARANPVMAGFAASLSADDIANLAAYFSTQTPKPGQAKNKDTIAQGQKLWRGGDVARGLPACASCHGPAGAGLPVQFPRLAGQQADYTEAQLKAFRSGERANDPAQMMRTIAAKLSDAEIKAVADYAAGLK
jgi:cytochrome c553